MINCYAKEKLDKRNTQMIKTIFQNLENANVEIHKHFNSLPRYTYKGNGQFSATPPNKSGIYIMFEDGEKIGNLDRIVRVGKAEQPLLTRLTQHFINEDKDHSIFRKHVGRALLQKGNYSQVDINNWNIKGIKCPQIEKKVTVELKRFSFCCIEDFSNIEEIKNLEQTLIETLSMYNRLYKKQTGKDIFSENWLGQDCTNDKVRTSGLWNDEHVRNWKK